MLKTKDQNQREINYIQNEYEYRSIIYMNLKTKYYD